MARRSGRDACVNRHPGAIVVSASATVVGVLDGLRQAGTDTAVVESNTDVIGRAHRAELERAVANGHGSRAVHEYLDGDER